jgi:hypothetical protein
MEASAQETPVSPAVRHNLSQSPFVLVVSIGAKNRHKQIDWNPAEAAYCERHKFSKYYGQN